MNPLKKKKLNWDLHHFGCPPSSKAMSPTSFSPLQCYTADLCRDRGFCITKFCVQILPLSRGINEFFCVYLASVTCFEHRVAWCLCRSLNNYGQLPITGTLTFSGIQCPSQTTLLENSAVRYHFLVVYIYLVPFQSIHLNQVIVF